MSDLESLAALVSEGGPGLAGVADEAVSEEEDEGAPLKRFGYSFSRASVNSRPPSSYLCPKAVSFPAPLAFV